MDSDWRRSVGFAADKLREGILVWSREEKSQQARAGECLKRYKRRVRELLSGWRWRIICDVLHVTNLIGCGVVGVLVEQVRWLNVFLFSGEVGARYIEGLLEGN
jgi:hypothetical protein